MKTTFFSVLMVLLCLQLKAQDFVDIFKMTVNNATLGNVDNDYETNVNNLNLEVYYPTRLNEKAVILTGFTVENTNLNFSQGFESSNLLMTRLNLGVKLQHSEKWAGTYVLLPKIASDFENLGGQDFQFGGLALLDHQVSEAWKLKYGLYVSSENHGSTITPLFGIWHRSKDEKFYINATLPIRADINYALAKSFSVGADLVTSIKSYNLSENDADLYVQEESIRFALYAAYGFMDNALLLKGRVGFDTTDYGLYNSNDTIGGQVLTFPLAGDDRDRNPEFEGALYFGADLIYRFDLRKEKK